MRDAGSGVADSVGVVGVPYIGQIVEYRYNPKASAPPVAAIVTRTDDSGWVSLYAFSELPRWIPHVEFGIHCKAVKPQSPF